MDRDQAVKFLRYAGLHASKRDWALGDTVMAAAGREEHGGITGFRDIVYIVPKNGRWEIEDLQPGTENRPFETLEMAAREVERILKGRIREEGDSEGDEA